MKLVQQQISNFLTSNITEPFPEWDSTTTYTFEEDSTSLTSDSVVRYGNYNYRSLTNDNLNFNPEDNLNTSWVKWSVSNRYAMIDISSTTKTSIADDDIVVEFLRGSIDLIGVGNLTASGIIIEHYNSADEIMPDATQNISFSVNEGVYDLWSYIYAEYSLEMDRGIKIDIPPLGYKIKVTIKKQASLNIAECGFFIAGEAANMGKTLSEIGFSFNSLSTVVTDTWGKTTIIKRNIQDLVDFETSIPRNETISMKRKIKSIYDEIVLFVIDPSDDSPHENILTLGKVQDADTVLTDMSKTIITWSVFESL